MRQSDLAITRLADEPTSRTSQWRWPSSPDPGFLQRLAVAQKICLALAGAIGAVILLCWLCPAAGAHILAGWAMMKANTAALIVLVAASLSLSRSGRRVIPPWRLFLSRVLASVVQLTAAFVLVEYISGLSFGIDTVLAADPTSPISGRMSPHTAFAFLLLGIVAFFIRYRRRAFGLVVDLLTFCLCPLLIFILSGYIFGVMRFFGVSSIIRTAPHTLLALALLTFVAISRRSEYGMFGVFAGAGIGSRIARMAAPFALILPFALEMARFSVSETGFVSRQVATASVTAFAAVVGVAVILALALRIDSLEQEVQSLSLRDDLTKLYNRRGFFLLAEREMSLARRTRTPFSLVFIDLDGLKQINDTFGHEAGSDFLRETAYLITRCFRVADVAARIGGDEFVVACATGERGVAQATERLLRAAEIDNAELGRRYRLHFSVGLATMQPDVPEALEELVKRADEAMYEAKRRNKLARA
jgi:diguanylate cyclase (GGDEF)-like protein